MLEGRLLPMLYVRDVPRAVAFYRNVLGFEFAGWWDDTSNAYLADPPPGASRGFAELRAGDLVLHLHATPSNQDSAASVASILHLRVKDADIYHENVSSRGGRFDPPRDQPWGWRQFYVRDPDGHRWLFSHAIERR